MKNDLEFLLTGTYRGISIGDSTEKLKEIIANLFHNYSEGTMDIYSDDLLTEFTFLNNKLHFIALKSFNKGFLSPKFKRTIKNLNKKKLEWSINEDLTFDKQLTIRVLYSSVDLIFDMEEQDKPILKKAGYFKQIDKD